VLADFNFLHHFPEGGTIASPVFTNDPDLLGAFGLLTPRKGTEQRYLQLGPRSRRLPRLSFPQGQRRKTSVRGDQVHRGPAQRRPADQAPANRPRLAAWAASQGGVSRRGEGTKAEKDTGQGRRVEAAAGEEPRKEEMRMDRDLCRRKTNTHHVAAMEGRAREEERLCAGAVLGGRAEVTPGA
jgi:hypothetical protein